MHQRGLDGSGILAARPWLQFRGYGQRIHITTREKSTYFEGDPFDTLRAISDAFRIEENDLPQPMAAGLFGYLGFHGTMDLNIAIRTAVLPAE
jgi:para-aminobenzoate synthetase component 1